ncbi:MAG: hypothetical protein P1P64_00895 [Treponemataceae bacterium]
MVKTQSKKLKIFLFIIFVFSFQARAFDLDLNLSAGNFAFLDDGTFLPKVPDFGFGVEITDTFTDMVGAVFNIKRTPVIGNLLKARVTFGGQKFLFSLGPSIGILNRAHKKGEFSSVFQPGMGVGMHIQTEKGFMAGFDIDFSIYTGLSHKNIYINNGEVELGMRAKNVLVSFNAKQVARTWIVDSKSISSSLIDFGLNFEVFSKPSPIVFPFACIFRIAKYQNGGDSSLDSSLGALLLKAGLIHNIYNGVGYYIIAEVPVYSRALKGEPPKTFRYNLTLGTKFNFD